jgi:carbon dioxide concentrating mechanism protein CcmM
MRQSIKTNPNEQLVRTLTLHLQFFQACQFCSCHSPNGFTLRLESTLSQEAGEQVRSLLSQGYKIGTEHVDKRRFQTNSWASCTPIDAQQESEAIAALEACLANHDGEYVRLFGIDTKTKRRVLETIIQRPDGKSSQNSSNSSLLTIPAVSAARPTVRA